MRLTDARDMLIARAVPCVCPSAWIRSGSLDSLNFRHRVPHTRCHCPTKQNARTCRFRLPLEGRIDGIEILSPWKLFALAFQREDAKTSWESQEGTRNRVERNEAKEKEEKFHLLSGGELAKFARSSIDCSVRALPWRARGRIKVACDVGLGSAVWRESSEGNWSRPASHDGSRKSASVPGETRASKERVAKRERKIREGSETGKRLKTLDWPRGASRSNLAGMPPANSIWRGFSRDDTPTADTELVKGRSCSGISCFRVADKSRLIDLWRMISCRWRDASGLSSSPGYPTYHGSSSFPAFKQRR